MQRFPYRMGLQHQRQFACVTTGKTHPAPVATGLFATDNAFFQDCDPDATSRELKCGRNTDDPAADDCHINRLGQVFGIRDRGDRGHVIRKGSVHVSNSLPH